MSDIEFDLHDHFLIAMPGLHDYHFDHALVYICAHNEDGTMGIVVNRPIIDVTLGEVLLQMDIEAEDGNICNLPVYLGGPVQPERGFILHQPNREWQSTLVTSERLAVTSSQDILQAMAIGEGPKESIVILGYSGWGAGQLEAEIANNLWLTAPADPEILFHTPYHERWRRAVHSLGIDVNNLSDDVGHA